ncbi:MAG: hypothetical protein IKO40_07990 [Kiritimatiellae bacterium]|nr:hypothetical protein [Kiritimatiellia bacterium]
MCASAHFHSGSGADGHAASGVGTVGEDESSRRYGDGRIACAAEKLLSSAGLFNGTAANRAKV